MHDNSFILHVIIAALLILGFMAFLQLWGKPKHRTGYEARCKNIVDDLIARINVAKTDADITRYRALADDFYEENYELLGMEQSLKYSEVLSAAIIRRSIQLKRAGVKS